MKLFDADRPINFMGIRKITLGLSVFLIIVSIISIAVKGFNFGLDFTGGVMVELKFPQEVDLEEVRSQLEENGFKEVVAQYFGKSTDVLIRLPPSLEEEKSKLGEKMVTVLQKHHAGVTLKRVEFVGPQVGDELRDQGGIAMLVALFSIMVYILFRFSSKFALGGILSLLHVTIVTLGLFSITGMQFDLVVLAGVLALIGYAINDTIVVFDRIRENFRKYRKQTVEEVINISLTETLDRTIMTAFATMLSIIALFLFGGEIMRNFSIALIFGILIGTYSSIYMASNLLLVFKATKEDLMEIPKEGEEIDNRP